MKLRYVAIIAVSAAAGVLAVWRLGTGMFWLLSGVNVALIVGFAGIGVSRYVDRREDQRNGFAVKDERTTLIEGKAGRLAFNYENFVWLGIMWYLFIADNFTGWPLLETQEALLMGPLVNLGIYFASLFYYRKEV